jgi:DNA repair protein REV1
MTGSPLSLEPDPEFEEALYAMDMDTESKMPRDELSTKTAAKGESSQSYTEESFYEARPRSLVLWRYSCLCPLVPTSAYQVWRVWQVHEEQATQASGSAKHAARRGKGHRRREAPDILGPGHPCECAVGSQKLGLECSIAHSKLNGDAGGISNAKLSQLVTTHGGTWLPYLDKKTLATHILATNLTPKKREDFKSYKVVLPQWIVRSVEEGRLLDWRDFRLETADLARGSDQDSYGPTGGPATQKTLFSMVDPRRASGQPSATTERVGEASSSSAAPPSMRWHGTNPIPPKTPSKDTGKSTVRSPSISPSKRYNAGTDPTRPHLAAAALAEGYYPHHSNERAAKLLSDPAWRAQHTSINPDFISHFFSQSRLHYLSTAKAGLHTMVARLRKELGKEPKAVKGKKPARPLKGTAEDGRTIWHVDLDCFFVSAGLVARPELKGKPVAVCHAKDGDREGSTSEIASCSYEARAFGIRNGMRSGAEDMLLCSTRIRSDMVRSNSLGRARNLCPSLATIPYDFDAYKRISETFYRILLSHADDLQAVSVDEAYVDVSSQVPAGSDDPSNVLALAERVRSEILDATSCAASVGSSYNMLLARLATRKAKPASSFHLSPDDVVSFLAPLDVDDLPNIGHSTEQKLQEILNVTTVGELLAIHKERLKSVFGPQLGETYYNQARGIDPRPLASAPPRKSVSAEVNYGIRFDNNDQVEVRLALFLFSGA